MSGKKQFTTEERFWAKVDKTEACWNWSGATSKEMGYGMFQLDGKVVKAHRLAWRLAHGDFPNAHVLHKCDNTKCVNPEHLFLGMWEENNVDMTKKERHGHTKISDKSVIKLRSFWRKHRRDMSQQRIADLLGVKKSLVTSVLCKGSLRKLHTLRLDEY